MINKNIIKIRRDLDKLDNKFLAILKERTKLVDLVLKNKSDYFLSHLLHKSPSILYKSAL